MGNTERTFLSLFYFSRDFRPKFESFVSLSSKTNNVNEFHSLSSGLWRRVVLR